MKNRFGLRDPARLEELETLSFAVRSEEPLPDGYFSLTHYKAVHRHLFHDVYRWAGRYRTVRISKEQSTFCFPENIREQMAQLFARLTGEACLRGLESELFVRRAAAFLAELNAIHPFREGNGRAQSTFLGALAARAGHPLNLGRLDPEAFRAGMVRSFYGDEEPLVIQLRAILNQA